MKSEYRIAGISVQVDAANELTDCEAFSLYRVGDALEASEEKEIFNIRMIPEETLQIPHVQGQIVFEDLMHRVVRTEQGLLQLFRVPMMNRVSAWNWIPDGNDVEIHYVKGLEAYYLNSIGCFNVAAFERVLYAHKKYLFHCSYVDSNGKAVLFSAPSGGGKTTQGELWEKYGNAEMVNGDRAVLECTDNGYLVHGLPIAGSSGVFINRTCPLSAIFVVKKAPENRVTRLSHDAAFHAVFSEITMNNWNSAFVLDAVDFAMKLADTVPVYELECTISEEAVQKAKEVVL